MIAEIGHALLWLAAGCALLQAAGLMPRLGLGRLTVTAAGLQAWLWLWILACLAWSFWITDLSVAGVAATTDTALPAPLKLAAIVVQPGGGLIVLALLLAMAGGAAAFFAARRRRLLGGLGVAALAATAALLAAQPFARLVPAPTAGAGFPVTVRAALAGLGAPGAVATTALRLGEQRGAVALRAVTPVAGPDSTGVLAQVSVAGAVLTPRWQETIRPAAGFAVAANGRAGMDWITATVRPLPDGRWAVGWRRFPLGWVVLALLAAGLGGWLWRRR